MNQTINPIRETWNTILERPNKSIKDIKPTVIDVFENVKENGDEAIKNFTKIFDKIKLKKITVSDIEIEQAKQSISDDLKEAIAIAKSNIEAFHKAQKTEKIILETSPGVTCWQEKKPIQKVGLYIPGGTAPLFSTVLMLAIPAQIAGCEEIILCSPPNEEKSINPVILYTANLCGITKIFKVGGIQAIAGMTFGTMSIPKVYKIFGPGNQYVTVAKQYATQFGIAIDMPAGPSELLIIADRTANPVFVASDLLSQAEHGIDSQVILVSTSKKMLENVTSEIEKQLDDLPRKDIAKQAIENSKFVFFNSEHEALEFINEYGPEHFIICCKNEDFYINGIKNAGSVFIGNYTPESAGDYASGTNHTLPTNGYTKNYSGVNLDSFTKSMTFQKITKEGIKNIGKTIEIMANAEGLQAHKNAVTLRLKAIENEK